MPAPEAILALPLSFHEWPALWQAVTLALATFVQEDLPTVSSALLASAGQLGWATAFWGCFLGIWVGDALLYGLARGVGRPLLDRPWARRWVKPERVAQSEKWFARQRHWLLITSRFIPGMRLPTYLAAGFLRLPFHRFLLITGVAVAFWTVLIFGLARVYGPALMEWLQRWRAGFWALPLAALALVGLLRLALWLVTRMRSRQWRVWAGRWTRWEFWPAWLFYPPVALYYTWLALRHRSLTLPSAANPGMFSGGMVGESKVLILQELAATSPEFTAPAFPVEGVTFEERLHSVRQICHEAGFRFPFILKPDVGQRGDGVKLVRTPEELENCLRQNPARLIVQRYAPGPFEVGVFYYRFPGEERGQVFAVTEKIFPVLTGDGVSTAEELLWRDPRARYVAATYLRRLGARAQQVPAAGATVKLVEAGNHCQGCIFRDGRHLLSPELEARIDAISRGLHGFFIGRYDLRYESEEDFRAGRAFQIIELNGASSEATSIYDARHSLWHAYRTLFRQWDLVFAIGAANRARGCRTTPAVMIWRRWRAYLAQAATFPVTD